MLRAQVASGGLGSYSDATMRSLELIDQELLNYELIEALVCQVGLAGLGGSLGGAGRGMVVWAVAAGDAGAASLDSWWCAC